MFFFSPFYIYICICISWDTKKNWKINWIRISLHNTFYESIFYCSISWNKLTFTCYKPWLHFIKHNRVKCKYQKHCIYMSIYMSIYIYIYIYEYIYIYIYSILIFKIIKECFGFVGWSWWMKSTSFSKQLENLRLLHQM